MAGYSVKFQLKAQKQTFALNKLIFFLHVFVYITKCLLIDEFIKTTMPKTQISD